jgi:hypothetical protein
MYGGLSRLSIRYCKIKEKLYNTPTGLSIYEKNGDIFEKNYIIVVAQALSPVFCSVSVRF